MSPVYDIVPATRGMLEYVAKHARPADRAELWAAQHSTPEEVLRYPGLEPEVGRVSGRPVCAFGVSAVTLLGFRIGTPWMIATPAVEDHAIAFLRRNREWVKTQLERYDALVNYVDSRNEKAVKWLRYLGFTIDPPAPYGVEGRSFHRFTAIGDT